MSRVRAFLLSILVHSLLIFAFVELKPQVKNLQGKQVKINLSFVRIKEEKKSKVVVEGIRKFSKKRVQKHHKVKKAEQKKVAEIYKKAEIEKSTSYEKIQRKEPELVARREEIEPQKITTPDRIPQTEKAPEILEEKTQKSAKHPTSYSLPLPENTSMGIGDEEVKEKEDYEKEYREENLVRIREIIRSYLSYPVIARRMGWEGTVVVRFLLTSEGEVKKVSVEKSSGFEVLDRNALEVIKLASREFPKPRRDVVVVIPVVYRLEE